MPNEIRILVRTQNSAKAGMDQVNRDMEIFAKESSEKFTKTFSDHFNKDFTETITTRLRTVGDQAQGSAQHTGDRIGNTIGQRITERISQRVKVDVDGRLKDDLGRLRLGGNGKNNVHVNVDVDKQSLLSRMFGVGKEAEGKFEGGFKEGASSFFSGDFITLILKGVGFAGIGTALAPILGATISSAVLLALGSGAIGVGIAGALKSPTVQSSLAGLKKNLGGIFATFGENFAGPLDYFFTRFNGFLDKMKPTFDKIGEALGPVTTNLADGIIGFLQNAMPGISRAIIAAGPIIDTLSSELPGIGDALGRFFDHIKEASPQATVFFNDLLNFIELVIRALGWLIEKLTKLYAGFRDIFFGMVGIAADWAVAVTSAASIAFGWVPGLGPKLDHAAHAAAQFKEKVNKQLRGIDNRVDVTIRIKTVGLNTLNAAFDIGRKLKALGYLGKAAGGVIGHAAEGGSRNGLTLVGEQGPELVDLPAGSQVHTNGDSKRMLAGNGSDAYVGKLLADRTSERGLVDVLMSMLRVEIYRVAGGNVQQALGR